MDDGLRRISMKNEWEFISSYLYDVLEIGDLSTLCGDRVVQMTKTYNDIDAVTKLLEEKEKDLELAAKIGQSLLQQNKQLENRIELIEENLTVISDQNTQLHHDIKLKDDLLRIYTNDISQSDSDEEATTSEKSKMCLQSKYIDIDTLQKKIKNLEEENLHLRIETAELRTESTQIEEKEEQLVRDCFKQLGEARGSVEILTDELSKKFEDNMRQQEEITNLLAKVVDLQQKVKKLSVENQELTRHLQASKEAQQELTKEVLEYREKYDEVYTMLQEAQETAKKSNRSSISGGIGFGTYLNPLPVFPADSLAAELVDSVEQSLEKDPHLSKKGKREYNKSVMNTVKSVNKRNFVNSPASGYSSSDFFSHQTSPSSSLVSLVGSERSEMYEGDSESVDSSSGNVHKPQVSVIPGSNDLATALRRLKLRRDNENAERDYAELHTDSPTGTRSPSGSFSSGLSGLSGMSTLPAGGGGGQTFRGYMPEKLQIVKPMEGSMTLHHWQRLATPHIASMLDVRPGVVVKGFREFETKRDSFHLDEIEDDGCIMSSFPSRGFANTSSTFTYTTSRQGQHGNTMMTSMNPYGTRMTIGLHHNNNHDDSSTPGVYDPPPGAALGLASVLATPHVTSGSAVRLKASQTSGRTRKSSIGLNFLSTSPISEKKAELDVEAPSGVHKVSGNIFSRNASPAGSISSGIKILDAETKQRLLEKVRSIRAEKAAEKAAAKMASYPTTNAIVLAPSAASTTASLGSMMMSSTYSSMPRMSVMSNGGTSLTGALGPPPGSSRTSGYASNSGMSTIGSGSMMMSSSYSSTRMSVMGSGSKMSSTFSSGSQMSVTGIGMASGMTSPSPSSTQAYLMPSAAASPSTSSVQISNRSSATTHLSASSSTRMSELVAPRSLTASQSVPSALGKPSVGLGLLSPGSSPFPPVLGQARVLSSPMSVLAASRPIAMTTTTCDTTTAGLGTALEATGLGEVLDITGSPKGKQRTVISKTKLKSSSKKL